MSKVSYQTFARLQKTVNELKNQYRIQHVEIKRDLKDYLKKIQAGQNRINIMRQDMSQQFEKKNDIKTQLLVNKRNQEKNQKELVDIKHNMSFFQHNIQRKLKDQFTIYTQRKLQQIKLNYQKIKSNIDKDIQQKIDQTIKQKYKNISIKQKNKILQLQQKLVFFIKKNEQIAQKMKQIVQLVQMNKNTHHIQKINQLIKTQLKQYPQRQQVIEIIQNILKKPSLNRFQNNSIYSVQTQFFSRNSISMSEKPNKKIKRNQLFTQEQYFNIEDIRDQQKNFQGQYKKFKNYFNEDSFLQYGKKIFNQLLQKGVLSQSNKDVQYVRQKFKPIYMQLLKDHDQALSISQQSYDVQVVRLARQNFQQRLNKQLKNFIDDQKANYLQGLMELNEKKYSQKLISSRHHNDVQYDKYIQFQPSGINQMIQAYNFQQDSLDKGYSLEQLQKSLSKAKTTQQIIRIRQKIIELQKKDIYG